MSVVIDGTSGITFPDASSQSAAAESPSTNLGDVGTYAYLCTNSYTTTITSGSTYAGSGLRPAGVVVLPSYTSYAYTGGCGVGVAVSGTWRAMGSHTYNGFNANYSPATVFVRIA